MCIENTASKRKEPMTSADTVHKFVHRQQWMDCHGQWPPRKAWGIGMKAIKGLREKFYFGGSMHGERL
jgi:hypothetical protein